MTIKMQFRVGLYGISRVGKTTLAFQVEQTIAEFIRGGELEAITTYCSGNFSRFIDLNENKSNDIR